MLLVDRVHIVIDRYIIHCILCCISGLESVLSFQANEIEKVYHREYHDIIISTNRLDHECSDIDSETHSGCH